MLPASDTPSPAATLEGVVNKPANLHREPDHTIKQLRTVQRGTRVRILSDNDSWYEVEILTEEGTEQDAIKRGWMMKRNIDVD